MINLSDNSISYEAMIVRNALVEQGLENKGDFSKHSAQEKKSLVEQQVVALMQIFGLDLDDDSIKDTPSRVANMLVDELFSGLDYRNFPNITVFENQMRCDEPVKIEKIAFTSTCEHHLVVMDGFVDVEYIPKEKIIGLSKVNRVVRFFASRPQVQERMTRQIMVALQTLLETESVAVRVSATHYCVKARGIRDQSSMTTTTASAGIFKIMANKI